MSEMGSNKIKDVSMLEQASRSVQRISALGLNLSALFLKKNEHQEIKTRVNHLSPNCESNQKVLPRA